MSESMQKQIMAAHSSILARIESARIDQGERSRDVHLVAVSKTFPKEVIEPVLKNGQRIFGENKVQEAQSKWIGLKNEFPDCELHLIGPLQTNKAKDAVALFDVIQTLDRPKLAKILAKEIERQNKKLKLFIQVNTGDEPQKAGVSISDLPDFTMYCRDELKLPIIGLMCIPPQQEDAKKHFLLLKNLAGDLDIENLSMGMSSDFETAINCGANYVRVGTAIFGGR